METSIKKVEVDDPQLSNKERLELISQYFDAPQNFIWESRKCCCTNEFTGQLPGQKIQKAEIGRLGKNLKGLDPHKGAVITSNHFNPLENTIIRKMTEKLHKRLYIVRSGY